MHCKNGNTKLSGTVVRNHIFWLPLTQLAAVCLPTYARKQSTMQKVAQFLESQGVEIAVGADVALGSLLGNSAKTEYVRGTPELLAKLSTWYADHAQQLNSVCIAAEASSLGPAPSAEEPRSEADQDSALPPTATARS